MAKIFGYNFPFYKGKTLSGGTSSVLPRQEDERIIRNDYQQGLLTVHGERVFRPTFGGNIPASLFEQNDLSQQNAIKDSIKYYTSKYHPNITVTSINLTVPADNPNVLVITVLGYTVLNTVNKDMMLATFQVPLAGP